MMTMITLKQGSVVTVLFPYSNLSDSKQRPGLILSPEQYSSRTSELLVAQITSRNSLFRNQYGITNWAKAGLRKPSWVRYLALQHIHSSLIVDVLGDMPRDEYHQIVPLISQAIALQH